MIDTVDLTSYQPGYDQYCKKLERESRVPYSDYERLEEKVGSYNDLISDIKSTLDEKTTLIERFKIIKALIDDFEEQIK